MEKQKNNKLHRQLFVSLRHHVGDSFIEKQRLLIYICEYRRRVITDTKPYRTIRPHGKILFHS